MLGSRDRLRHPSATVPLEVAGLSIELAVSHAMEAVVRGRYAGFVAAPTPRLEAQVRLLAPQLTARAAPRRTLPRLRVTALNASRFRVEGDLSGNLDLAARCGRTGSRSLWGLDSLLRLSLAQLAVAHGWLLMHGAAIATRGGGLVLLLGRSGAGKSTAARAFRSYCDELTLVRPDGEGSEAASTPYWQGRPVRAVCRGVICLERGGGPGVSAVQGAAAVQALLPHVVRYAGGESGPIALATLCAVARHTPVMVIRCPEGAAYLPFLRRGLAEAGLPPCAAHEEGRYR